jgi:hypothetical protein
VYEATGKNRFHKVGISDRRPTLTAQFQPHLVFIAWFVSLSRHSANNTKGRRRDPCHEISRHCRIQRKQGDSQLFHGVNVGNTTGRVYNVQTLLEMKDYGCFFQATLRVVHSHPLFIASFLRLSNNTSRAPWPLQQRITPYLFSLPVSSGIPGPHKQQ